MKYLTYTLTLIIGFTIGYFTFNCKPNSNLNDLPQINITYTKDSLSHISNTINKTKEISILKQSNETNLKIYKDILDNTKDSLEHTTGSLKLITLGNTIIDEQIIIIKELDTLNKIHLDYIDIQELHITNLNKHLVESNGFLDQSNINVLKYKNKLIRTRKIGFISSIVIIPITIILTKKYLK